MAVLPPAGVVDEFTRGTAVDALALAKKVEQEIDAHEDLCAERYKTINEKLVGVSKEISGLRAIFIWCGGAAFTLLLAAFGFLINMTTTANQTLQERNRAADIAATRIELLQDALQRERRLTGSTPFPPTGAPQR